MRKFDRILPRVAIFAAIVLLAAILSPLQPAAAGDAVSHTIDVNGVSRSYLLYVPSGQSGKRLPAFIMMHGSGSTDTQQERYSNFDTFGQAHGLVVMYPNGIDKHWNDGRVIGHESMADDIGFMKAMLAEVTAQGLIDPKRVYAAGISNGGFMAQHMACVMPDALAGIAVIAATLPVDAACPSPRPMPVVFFHGTEDKFVPFNGGPIAPQFGNRGSAISNAQAVAIWQKRNGCGAAQQANVPAKDTSDPLPVTLESYSCPAGRGLENVIVQGGGHTWPGARQGWLGTKILGPVTDNIDANATMWTFFQSQSPK
ncbi:MAG TPA: PHB depolymerase family esterase [Candidatus Binatus sp.]|uniref:alpha/beta hydrolase family esterase n=1 Tax=Candidatus Binatus sp. TaxID=2811406 RepID=UPI002F423433